MLSALDIIRFYYIQGPSKKQKDNCGVKAENVEAYAWPSITDNLKPRIYLLLFGLSGMEWYRFQLA